MGSRSADRDNLNGEQLANPLGNNCRTYGSDQIAVIQDDCSIYVDDQHLHYGDEQVTIQPCNFHTFGGEYVAVQRNDCCTYVGVQEAVQYAVCRHM